MRLFIWIFSITLTLSTSAQTQAQSPERIRAMEGVTEYRLTNGLQVLLAPNDLHTRVYASLVVKAGSAVEGFGEGGMAHLLEHMVFKGTPTTRDAMKALTDRSISYGGTTGMDHTNYFGGMNPSLDNLHWYLGWLADASTNSYIAKADLDKEMTVVRNEFERAAGDPGNGLYAARMALTFPNHGYGRPTFGNQSDIENVNIERLHAFYKTWYRPDNMALVVTGKFDEPAALSHIQSVFGGIKTPTTPLPQLYTREAVQEGLKGMTLRRAGGEPMTLLGWRTVPHAHFDDAVLDVVAHTLVNQSSGRLNLALSQQNLGSSPFEVQSGHAQHGIFSVAVQARESRNFDAIRDLVLKQIDAIAKNGVTAEELRRAQTFYTVRNKVRVNTADAWGVALASGAAMGDWRLPFWHTENFSKVTIEDTKRVTALYIIPANNVRVSFSPYAATETPQRAPDAKPFTLGDYVAKTDDTKLAIKLERFAATAEEFDKRTIRSQLPVGTKVALLARPSAGEVMHGTLRLHWGNLEKYKKWNAEYALPASFAAYFAPLMLKGSSKRNQKQLEDALNELQSSLNASSSLGGLTVNFQTTRANWSAFEDILANLLREPSFMQANFDTSIFERWKRDNIAALNGARDTPATLAEEAMSRTLWRFEVRDPRYVMNTQEKIAYWQTMRLEELRDFWRQFVGASVSEFSAVGALDVDAVQNSVAQMMEGWQTPASSGVYAPIPYALPSWTAGTQTISTPDKPSASLLSRRILTYQPFTKESNALVFASNIIGATDGSRLLTRLRKVEGLSYGTYSGVHSDQDNRLITFGFSGTFAPQNRAHFEKVLNEEKQNIALSGLTPKELEIEKLAAQQRVRAELDNDGTVASMLAENEYRGRNFAFWRNVQTLQQNITLDDLNAAAKRLLDTPDFATVITGDFKK